jgi:peptide/nickel transport system substrate-binding protein
MKPSLVSVLCVAIFGATSCLGAPAIAQSEGRPEIHVSSGATDNATFDPDRATSTDDIGVVQTMFNGLVRFLPGSADPAKLEPDLATKWQTSADGKVWTFTLRPNVKFHGNYGTLSADDVVYSIERAADRKRSSFAGNFTMVSKVEAVDPLTVRITLKYPDAAFLGRVSNYHGGNIVSKKAAEALGDKFGNGPIGTGPFMFVEHITQQYVKLVANDQYFRGKPKIGSIIYRMIPSDSARELAFTSNELDVMQGKREQRWVERARKNGMPVDIFEPSEFRILHINRDIKPLDNVKVRQAVAMAINVDEIVRYVGKDVAATSCSVVPNGYLGQNCDAGQYKYDVAGAKKLLAEAGFPNGIEIKSVVSNISAQQPIMEIVQSQLAKAGIKLNMEVVDHATYQAKSRKDQSGLVFYGAARYPDSDTWLTEFFDSASAIGAPAAMSNFSHCAVGDADIHAARIEPDAKKQQALWKDAQTKIHDDVCAIPLFGLKQVWVHSPRVKYGYDLQGALSLAPPITESTTVTAP